MLGTDESLMASALTGAAELGSSSSSISVDTLKRNFDVHDGWGLFPRIFHDVIQRMAAKKAPSRHRHGHDTRHIPFLMSASAIEFYLGGVSDLLSPARPVRIDPDTSRPMGVSVVRLMNMEDLMSFLKTVMANRATRGTKMNEASGLHGGSSRSHAALILNLHQVDPNSNRYCHTTFTIMDLAGAERPSKTGEKRYSGAEMLLYMKEKGEEIPTGCQALIINYELSSFATEILRVSEANKRDVKYQPPTQLATEVTKFLGGCFKGETNTMMMMCLSQSSNNAWETWFSLQYGKKIAKLRMHTKHQTSMDLDVACDIAERKARAAAGILGRAAQNKCLERKRQMMRDAEYELEQIRNLKDAFHLHQSPARCSSRSSSTSAD